MLKLIKKLFKKQKLNTNYGKEQGLNYKIPKKCQTCKYLVIDSNFYYCNSDVKCCNSIEVNEHDTGNER